MPNIKSAIKRVETNAKANERNSSQKAAMRTAIKKFDAAVESNADNKEELFVLASKAVDKAESKGLIHKNKAGRDKSRMAAKLAK